MVSGYEGEKIESIKIDTELPISKIDLKEYLNKQKIENNIKNYNNMREKNIDENNLIYKDIQNMKKTILIGQKKKNILKKEFTFHNNLLKQKRIE